MSAMGGMMVGRMLTKSFGRGAFLLVPVVMAVVIGWKLLVFSARFISGAPLLGRDHATTDATFLDDARGRVKKPHMLARNRPTRWSMMAYWKRALWRLVATVVAAALVYGWFYWPTATVVVGVVILGVVAGVKEGQSLHWLRVRHHLTRYVRPLHTALAPRLEIDPDVVQPSEWLYVPRNFADAEAKPCIRVDLPPTFYATNEDEDEAGGQRRATPKMQQVVDGLVFSKLGLNPAEMTTRYHLVGPSPRVEYRHLPAVPELVSVDMVGRDLAKAKSSTVVFGMTKGGRVVKFDLAVDNPHVLLSVPTRGGKSRTIRAAVTPLLPKDKDVRVVMLDIKHVSQMIFREHPHVRIVRHIADIHDELVFLGKEVDRRNQAAWNGESPGPRIIVVVEEANSLADLLAEHWAGVKPSGQTGPNPAIAGLRRVPFMGAEALMHQILVSQEGNMRATGGGGARGNYGHGFLGRGSTKSAWRMIAPEMKQPPPKKAKRGRMYYVGGAAPEELQVVDWTDDETLEYAFRGFAAEERVSGSQYDRESFYQGKRHVTVTDSTAAVSVIDSHENMNTESYESVEISSNDAIESVSYDHPRPALELVAGESAKNDPSPATTEEISAAETVESDAEADELVTLREAIENNMVFDDKYERADPLGALRRVANSKPGTPRYDPEFPRPAGQRGKANAYRAADLQRWERNRIHANRARVSGKGGA